jgi:hypothetical protein
MQRLNLPEAPLNIRRQGGKDYVFDSLRRRFVRFTAEEYVRQSFVSFMTDYLHYPKGRFANEVSIVLGRVKKRCDSVIYDEFMRPLMIIEYKSPEVEISQSVFDQIARYNMALKVPWLTVTNGLQHFCCRVDGKSCIYRFEKEIPEYPELGILR